MKKIAIGALLLLVTQVQAQRTKIFSLSPMSMETANVNGLVVGIGHLDDASLMQKVNGVNIDLFVLSPMVLLYADPTRIKEEPTTLVSHGVNLGIGGFLQRGTVHRGVSVSMYNFGNELDGLSVQVAYASASRLRGLHISGIGNFSERFNGVAVGTYNKSDYTKGIQLGLVNRSRQLSGLQIGLFNVSEAVSGLQIGLWNENARRSFPFINF
ncbi:LA_2272 family surface repeat-containing protein [Sphingobacterium bambusae]|uniref:LA_2272 family surface repeat-containing protein n=1 Tax=Sphingobacterium bambusae TaxID=662858 RepID=A0ABW6B966_9SPHI|nr:hypothetical protein [Sphingobacterium bambusae]WPL48234.1 hypothetical protein SCB77_20000 [Sphingobacterium bambusae]